MSGLQHICKELLGFYLVALAYRSRPTIFGIFVFNNCSLVQNLKGEPESIFSVLISIFEYLAHKSARDILEIQSVRGAPSPELFLSYAARCLETDAPTTPRSPLFSDNKYDKVGRVDCIHLR